MAFEHYVNAGSRRLRMGYTTGSCAALAARAATTYLLVGIAPKTVALATPAGPWVAVDVFEAVLHNGAARCAVRKDAGDDPDITDGILVCARVAKIDGNRIIIDGGEGVGRVTKPGLDQPVGAAAINRVPRQMIFNAARDVCDGCGYTGGLSVTIEIPGGEQLAARTFNPRLGIEGGLSVIGTGGIVRPMSEAALLDTIRLEMNMQAAAGEKRILLVPGNTGDTFAGATPALAGWPRVQCSNYIGTALDMAAEFGFEALLLMGHAGKLVKLGGGIFNTHSKTAGCRLELTALHAALAGAEKPLLEEVLAAVSMERAIDLLMAARLWPRVQDSLLAAIQHNLDARVAGAYTVGAVWFTGKQGPLGQTVGANKLLKNNNLT